MMAMIPVTISLPAHIQQRHPESEQAEHCEDHPQAIAPEK